MALKSFAVFVLILMTDPVLWIGCAAAGVFLKRWWACVAAGGLWAVAVHLLVVYTAAQTPPELMGPARVLAGMLSAAVVYLVAGKIRHWWGGRK